MGTQAAETFDTNMQAQGTVAGELQECFVLKWTDYHTNVADSLKLMRADGDFLDTTVACSGSEQLQAHRLVLSAFSPYLKGMLRNNPQPNPVLIMPPNVRFIDLHSLLEFMYHGEVRVPADNLESLMQLAQLLKIKGLTEENEEEYPYKMEDKGNEDATKFTQPSDYIEPASKNDETSGAGIKLSGLICPQCRILIRGPAALKEHLAAAHGILGDQSPTQTPTKISQSKPESVGLSTATSEPGNKDNSSWSKANARRSEANEMTQPESFGKRGKKKRPLPQEEDLDDEDLEEHESANRYEESNRTPYDTNMNAPGQRTNLNVTSTQPNKRTGRGGSSRGRSPALGRANNPKERSMMGRMDNIQGKKIDAERSDRMEGRYAESPRHRRVSNNSEYTDDTSKSETHSMTRPGGQVSPAPKSGSNNNNTGVSKVPKRPSNQGRTKADPSKSLYYNM